MRAPLSGSVGGFRLRLGPCLLAVAFLLPAITAEAQIGVSPPRTEFLLDGPSKTHTIRVFNLGEETVDIAVEVNNWEIDEQNKVVILPPTEQSLDQWLVINPLRFTLESGGSQAVRFAARPRVEPEPGEHRALVYFQQVPVPADPAAPAERQILFRLGTSVIGLAEPIIRDAVIHSVTADAAAISIDVESRGNTHVRLDGQWALWTPALFPGRENTSLIQGLGENEEITLPEGMIAAWPLNTLPVLPGTRRVIATAIGRDLEPGTYILDLHGSVAETDLGRTLEIEVEAPPENPEPAAPATDSTVEGPDSAHETEPPSEG